MRILIGFGTRPELIKLAPVVHELGRRSAFEVVTLSTGQHRELVEQALKSFGITPSHDLAITRRSASLTELTAEILTRAEPILSEVRPDFLMVEGDTTSAFALALAAFYLHIPVAHVEAGLRSHDMQNPFPEELNRVSIGRIARLHFAPTVEAAANLVAEGVPEDRIVVTGNTVVDSLLLALSQESEGLTPQIRALSAWGGRTLLVTVHRRETWGNPLKQICRAVAALVRRHDDLQIVFPVHPGPQVRGTVESLLAGVDRVHLLEPLPYHAFAQLMKLSHLILTDSGGIQEEAPTLGKPVLVARNVCDRPESLERGSAAIVGTDEQKILAAVTRLLTDEEAHRAMITESNCYGDGKAAARICTALAAELGIPLE